MGVNSGDGGGMKGETLGGSGYLQCAGSGGRETAVDLPCYGLLEVLS